MKNLILFLLLLPSVASAQVLIPWGAPQEHHQVFGYLNSLESDLVFDEYRDYSHYVYFPYKAVALLEISSKRNRVHIEIGSFDSSSGQYGNFEEQFAAGARRIPCHRWGDFYSVKLSEEFWPVFRSWVERYPEAVLTIDRRWGSRMESFQARLSRLKLDEFERILTNLYRNSASHGKLLNLYLDLPSGETMEVSDLKGTRLVHFIVEDLIKEQKRIKFEINLPSSDEVFAKSQYKKEFRFFEAYQHLDQKLIPILMESGRLGELSEMPEALVRRKILEKAFSFYFSSENQRSKVCDPYLLKPIRSNQSQMAELDMFRLEEIVLDIPAVVTEINEDYRY